jgi:hypothetical protein
VNRGLTVIVLTYHCHRLLVYVWIKTVSNRAAHPSITAFLERDAGWLGETCFTCYSIRWIIASCSTAKLVICNHVCVCNLHWWGTLPNSVRIMLKISLQERDLVINLLVNLRINFWYISFQHYSWQYSWPILFFYDRYCFISFVGFMSVKIVEYISQE